MSNSTTPITNFTAGELSPKFDGRVDLSKYFNGCSTLENMTVFSLGVARRRGGFEYINEIKDSTKEAVLVPFEFSVEQAYILEFGEQYVRIYKDGVIVESGGSPVEVVTPYLESELPEVRYTQSADILFVVHPNHPPAEISRTSDTSWSYTVTTFTATPAEWVSQNYPSVVTFFQQRLCYAGTPNEPQSIWMSKTGDFRNFTTGSSSDDSIEITLDADQVNAIRWMLSGRLLLIGTNGGEWTVGGSATDAAIAPDNVQAQRQTTYGSAQVQAILVSSSVIYIERGGRRIREFAYLFEQDGYSSPDLTLLSDHIGRAGMITQMAYAKRPDSIFWMVRDDGALVSMTYQREEDVVALARHDTIGEFESVATIPGTSDTEVYVIVKRSVDGSDVRYIERLSSLFEADTTDDSTCVFLDSCAIETDVTAKSVWGGFDHLIGEEISVLADGATHPDVTVDASGNITLTRNANLVVGGLGYTSTISPMRLEGGSPGGVAQTKTGRIAAAGLRFYKTLGAKFGGDLSNLEILPFRSSADEMNAPPALFTGDKQVSWPTGWNTDRYVYVRQDQPLPLTLVMVVPYVTINR